MEELDIARGILLRVARDTVSLNPLAEALGEWAKPLQPWLTGLPADKAKKEPMKWSVLCKAVAKAAARPKDEPGTPRPHVLQLIDGLADMLALDSFDRALLQILVAGDRLPRLVTLVTILSKQGVDLPQLFGELAGAQPQDAMRLVRRSAAVRLGLVDFHANRQGVLEIDVRWTLDRLLDQAPSTGQEMVEALVGSRQTASLAITDFADPEGDIAFLVALLRGAMEQGSEGINILIHGPPGTGKTELARTLAATAGAELHAVGEVDDDGSEPSRWERVEALQLAQRVLSGRGKTALLFDEMEDLIGDAVAVGDGTFRKRQGSKVFVNRMIETNKVPVIWTTNAIDSIDSAILRRMSFVLKLDFPTRGNARRIFDRVAADEGITGSDALLRLIDTVPETATVLRVAARAGKLAGELDGAGRPAEALVKALRGGQLPFGGSDMIDIDLFECDPPLGPLIDRVAAGGALDVSMLLSGPPGTGKTALAHHFARALDRPLIVKRASDLLSRWVGGTEQNIAEAFAEARRAGGVLLFDEADSLLFDRSDAKTSWEVGQVNEMLTWLDRHPLPVVAATNFAGRLDPATLRRFVFKVALQPLRGEALVRAFERFFGEVAPAGLGELTNLTPGDFAVVARQLRHDPAPSPRAIVERLRREAEAKPGAAVRLGFG